MINNLTFITGNANKAKELERSLKLPVMHQKIDLIEVQSLDLYEIISHKAKEAYKILDSPVLVEDTSLEINALGKIPGPFIKWFLKEIGNEGICTMIHNFKSRDAVAKSVFGYYDGSVLKIFEGEIKGKISKVPKGKNGFGWDAIFIPKGSRKTRAEMSEQEQEKYSMRRIALSYLGEYLTKN